MSTAAQERDLGKKSTVRRANGGEAAPDEVYGVVSVLYHALQGVEACIQYFEDALDADDDELAEFFETCRFEQSKRAEKAKILLAERLEQLSARNPRSADP
jgi:hypothetical protein